MNTFPSPPMHTHGLNPNEIISLDDMDFLTTHYSAWVSAEKRSGEPDAEMAKKFTEIERARAATLYDTLRLHGFYPIGIRSKGIAWGIVLKSKCQTIFESDNPTPAGDSMKRLG